MKPVLYAHPFSSYCQKALTALYENGTDFDYRLLDHTDPDTLADFERRWPIKWFPILVDGDRTILEASIIIEYLDRHYPGAIQLLPTELSDALCVRLWDRFFDLYVQEPMQAIVADVRRADKDRSAQSVAEAQSLLRTAYEMIEKQLDGKTWITGENVTMADCAAAPALFYAETLVPFGEEHGRLKAYYQRLLDRPSFARVLQEAMPYFRYYPYREKLPAQFRPEKPNA